MHIAWVCKEDTYQRVVKTYKRCCVDQRQRFTGKWLGVNTEETHQLECPFKSVHVTKLLESAKKLVETQPEESFHSLVGSAEVLFPFSQKISKLNLALLNLVSVVKLHDLHLDDKQTQPEGLGHRQVAIHEIKESFPSGCRFSKEVNEHQDCH